MKRKSYLTGVISLVVFSLSLVLPVSAQVEVEPEDNPQLADACGLDIVMLLDMTGSISSAGAVDTVKGAAKDFVDAFLPDSPTNIGLVEFSNGTASVVQGLTDDESDLKSDIDGLTATGATNWEEAFLLGTALLEGGADRDDNEHADLMVIITDGDPNEPGTEDEALEAAIVAANLAKTSSSSLPIRIVAVGVAGPDLASLQAVSGDNVDDNPITKDTDVITGNFDDLAMILGNLADALCENECEKCNRSEINVVYNENQADVMNNVRVMSNTGRNYADGSYGGDGGSGGSIWNFGGGDVENSTTTDGGMGGNAGNGGTIYTGNASSTSNLANYINRNETDLELCPCGGGCCDAGDECGCSGYSIDANVVVNRNLARLINRTAVKANTGDNAAMGSYAGYGGAGGDIKNGNGGDVEDSGTGSGGNGGDAGINGEEGGGGGLISTGQASSRSNNMNRVNFNITRITR